MLDLCFQRPGTLLEPTDLDQPALLVGACVPLRRDDVRMLTTDGVESLRVRRLVEVPYRIGAEQRESVVVSELVPELLELDGAVGVAVLPEQIDHFAVQSDEATIGAPR